MAVIAAAAVASSAGFAAGSFAALAITAAGTLVDSYLLFPLLSRGSQDIEGPRLEDLTVQGAAEGSPARWALGPEVRTSGSVIWATDLVETRTTQRVGGKGGGGGGTQTSYSYSISCAVHVLDTDGLPDNKISKTLKVWANTKLIYDDNGGSPTLDARYDDLRLLNGDQTTPDSLIDASDPGNVPAYTRSALWIFEDLELGDFGNRLPNFEGLVQATATQTIADAIDRICTRAGLTSDQFDTTGITGDLRGIVSVGEQEMGKVLEFILLAYNKTVYESDGKLVFVDRDQSSPVTIEAELFGAREPGQSAASVPVPFSRKEVYDQKLPKRAIVRFIDPDCDYEQSSRTATKTNASGRELKRVELPLTLDPDDASEIAYRTLWSEWGIRDEVEGYLPPSMITLEAGDLIRVVDDSVAELIRLTSVTRGDNFIVRFRGRIEEPDIFTQYGITEDRSCIPTSGQLLPGVSAFFAITSHMVTDKTNTDRPLFYFAHTNTNPDTAKRSAIYYSRNDVSFQILPVGQWPRRTNFTDECRMGYLLTALPAPGPDCGYFWDKETTFDFEVYDSSWVPATLTDDDVLEGRNTIVLMDENGDPEVIGFVNVTSIGTNRYRASRLLRGRRATEQFAKAWGINTLFALAEDLDGQDGEERCYAYDDMIGVRPGGASEYELHFKAIPLGTPVGDITSRQHDTDFGFLRSFPAAHARVYRDGSFNATLAWHRRAQAYHSLFREGDGQIQHTQLAAYEYQEFEVDIYDPTFTNVVRTKTASKSPVNVNADQPSVYNVVNQSNLGAGGFFAITYTAAEQTADGYTPGDAINAKIYQKSREAYIDRGQALSVTL